MADGIKKAGGISFGVSMVTSQLGRDTKTARNMMGSFVNKGVASLNRLKNALNPVASAFGVAFGAAGLGAGIKSAMTRIDDLNKSAKTLGITADALSRLGYVADQSEASQDSLVRGLGRVARSTDDARRGVKETSDLYKSLGLNAKELARLAPDKQMLEIGTAIGNLKNESAQLVATQRIFGRSSADLVNVFKLSKTEIDKLTASADALGITVSGIDAETVAAANDAIDKMQASLGGVFNQLAIKVAPAVTKIADEFARAAANAGRLPGGEGGGFWSQASQLGGDVFRGARHLTTGMIGDVSTGSAAIARLFGYRNQTWDTFNTNMAHQFQGTRKSFVDNFIGRSSGGAGGMSGASPTSAAGSQSAFEFMKQAGQQFAGSALRYAQTPQQIVEGLLYGAVPRMQRQLLGAGLSGGGSSPATGKSFGVSSFTALESGSLAAHQQRIRGQQQFEKVEVKQLRVQERMAAGIDVIAGAMNGLVSEGAF